MGSESKIIWSDSAKNSFYDILDFLQLTWGQKQVDDFYNLTDKIIERIAHNPLQFPIYDSNIYKALIHRNVSLFYKISPNSNQIYLMLFFDNRKKPIQFK